MDAVTIGIDLGTGSSKGVAATADGTVVATGVRPRPSSLSMPRPGWFEVDAEEVWWGDVVSLCRELVGQLGDVPVAAVCVSGVGPSLVLADAQDRPLRPAILYGIDSRASAEIEELNRRYGTEEIVRRGGTELSAQAVGPKLLWVRHHEPEVFEAATGWYGSSSYVVKRLTGEYVLDHHTASQCDPIYDIAARDWYEPWSTDVLGDLPLPRLAWPEEVVGRVTDAAAEATGLPVGTPVCAGTVDAWAEAFSAGVRRPGDLMLMYGSTMFFVQVLRDLVRRPGLWTTCGVEEGTYSLAAGMSTSGSLTTWVRDLTGGAPFDDLVREAAAVPPGSDGLVLLPYFAGERTPVYDRQARGVVAGLTLEHGRAHLFRAVYEGIAYGIRQIVTLLDTPESPVERLVAVGGGTQGGLWTQVVSDVTGREQVVPEQAIGASFGDALLAALGSGAVPAGTDWARAGRVVTPDEANAATYAELFAVYADLYPQTRDSVHRLAVLQEDARA